MAIEVTIDRIILDGFEIPQRGRPLLETAVAAELSRLLAENGLSYQANIACRQLDGSTIPHISNDDPAQFGTHIAQSVYKGLTQ